MLRTRFTELVGCSIPIQQAAIGSACSPELAAAVSEAGGLGMLGCRPGGGTLGYLRVQLNRIAPLTNRPFGVNFLVPPIWRSDLDRATVELAARTARLVEFFYGWPEIQLVDVVHSAGALAAWQIGSREEALAAAEAGCDIVIAQCVAAGGHVRGTVGLAALLNEVLDAVNVPVLAAGGIGDGRAVAAALTSGASGVRVGTRFVAAQEANANPRYVELLIAARAQDTVYTEAFSGLWPGAPHRCLRSSVDAAVALTDNVVGERQLADGTRIPIHRFDAVTVDAQTRGTIDAMPLWAGESVGAVKRVQPAAAIVEELAIQAEHLLTRATAATV
jgi:NAD(P)H-dependent flavin oxidoreductase YrpB (nitropropane dioxygenase family)